VVFAEEGWDAVWGYEEGWMGGGPEEMYKSAKRSAADAEFGEEAGESSSLEEPPPPPPAAAAANRERDWEAWRCGTCDG